MKKNLTRFDFVFYDLFLGFQDWQIGFIGVWRGVYELFFGWNDLQHEFSRKKEFVSIFQQLLWWQ